MKTKKFVALLFAMGMMIALIIVPASAQEIVEANESTVLTANIAPRYIACSSGGKHYMSQHVGGGSGILYGSNGKVITNRLRVYRCRGCGLYVGCQYFPEVDDCLGGYVTGYAPGSGGSNIFLFYGGYEGYYWDLQEDSWIQGFDWYG